jgi:hypothetical protein
MGRIGDDRIRAGKGDDGAGETAGGADDDARLIGQRLFGDRPA